MEASSGLVTLMPISSNEDNHSNTDMFNYEQMRQQQQQHHLHNQQSYSLESYDMKPNIVVSAADTDTEIKHERKTNKLLSKSSIKKENSVGTYTKKIEKASKKSKKNAKHVDVKALMNSSLTEYDLYNAAQHNESGFGGTDKGNMNSSSDGDDKHDMSMNSSIYSSHFIPLILLCVLMI